MAENINDNEKSSIKDTEEAVPNSAIDNDNDNLIDGGSGLISPIRNNEENKNVINDNIEEEEEESMVWSYILAGFLTLITSIILSIFVNAFIAFVIIPAILIIYKGISNNNKNNTIVAHKLNRKFEKETTLVQSNNQNISKQNEHSKENSLLQQLFHPIHLNNRNSDKKKDEENQLIGNNDTKNNKIKDNLFKKNDKANMDLNENDFLKQLFSSNNRNSDKKKDEENKLENDEENKLENDEEEKNDKTKDNLFKENKNIKANLDLKDKNKNQDKEEEKEKSI